MVVFMSAQKAEKLSLGLFESMVKDYYENNEYKKKVEKELSKLKEKIKEGLAEYGKEHAVHSGKNPSYYSRIEFKDSGLASFIRTDTKKVLQHDLLLSLLKEKNIDIESVSERILSEKLLESAVLQGKLSAIELESCYALEKQTPKLYVELLKEEE